MDDFDFDFALPRLSLSISKPGSAYRHDSAEDIYDNRYNPEREGVLYEMSDGHIWIRFRL
jgi:hypothetical protein